VRRLLAAVVAASFALAGCTSGTQTAAADEQWPLHGHDAQEQRYSPLDQVNRETVGRLGLAWYHQFDDSDRGQEATPLVADGVIYTSTAWSIVYAFDAATGRQLWRYDPEVPRAALASTCCDAVNRGPALLNGRVYIGALDGRLIAIDARTGQQVWSVDTIDRSRPGRHYAITGAPRVVKDKIVIGNGGAEFGVRGYVTAYDAATGRQAWRFYLTPNPEGRPDNAASDEALRTRANATWGDGEWRESGGGGTAWDSMTFDPEANLLYIGAGNGSPFDYQRRSGGRGDNLFLSSIVAVDPDTGRYAWHYQTTPQDAWDFTATQHMIAAHLTINGQPRDVLMQAPKNGFFYVLDRRTGELLSAAPYAPVTWATGIDMRTGRPNLVPNAHYTNGPAMLQPGPFGAHSWQAMSYSPRTGLVYIPVQLMGGAFAADPNFRRRPIGQNVAIALPEFPVDQLAQIRAATTGQLLAWDPVAQRARWSVPHPWFLNGGTLATAGDLVFQGNADGQFVAYDATNGRKLWSYETQNGIIAPPITYRINGEQYVAVMVGFGGAGAIVGRVVPDRPRMPGRLMVFKLGGTAQAPRYPEVERAPINIAGLTSTGDATIGEVEYNRTCSTCHGANASIAYTADLRRSAALRSPDLWRSIVIDGALRDSGMIAFSEILTPAEAENIRAYVLRNARQSQARGER
jgi:quinohemoprotein ethanol dehydrogenase